MEKRSGSHKAIDASVKVGQANRELCGTCAHEQPACEEQQPLELLDVCGGAGKQKTCVSELKAKKTCQAHELSPEPH